MKRLFTINTVLSLFIGFGIGIFIKDHLRSPKHNVYLSDSSLETIVSIALDQVEIAIENNYEGNVEKFNYYWNAALLVDICDDCYKELKDKVQWHWENAQQYKDTTIND